jgi:hypothetical protein
VGCNEREHDKVTDEDDGRGMVVGFGVSNEEGKSSDKEA